MKTLYTGTRGPRDRFIEALLLLVKEAPLRHVVDDYLDGKNYDLQQFCVARARCQWMTGIGIIEAAEMLVNDAFESTTIDSAGNVL